MSNFSHLFDCDERDTHVPTPTDNVLMHEYSLNETLKGIATYQMDDYFMKLHDLNELVEKRNMLQMFHSSSEDKDKDHQL